MIKRQSSLVLLALVLLLPSVNARAQNRELVFSLGVGTGDYNNSFVAGLSWAIRLLPFVHGEMELFYYRMPADRATAPGLAITSTALDFNFSVLLQADVPGLRFVPYAVITGGRLYESETWKWSATHTESHKSYTRWDAGIGAGAKIDLGGRSGLRVDFRWIRILDKNHNVPRYSVGYIFRF
jgi:hypothetical protein